jgi:hypothetical protein
MSVDPATPVVTESSFHQTMQQAEQSTRADRLPTSSRRREPADDSSDSKSRFSPRDEQHRELGTEFTCAAAKAGEICIQPSPPWVADVATGDTRLPSQSPAEVTESSGSLLKRSDLDNHSNSSSEQHVAGIEPRLSLFGNSVFTVGGPSGPDSTTVSRPVQKVAAQAAPSAYDMALQAAGSLEAEVAGRVAPSLPWRDGPAPPKPEASTSDGCAVDQESAVSGQNQQLWATPPPIGAQRSEEESTGRSTAPSFVVLTQPLDAGVRSVEKQDPVDSTRAVSKTKIPRMPAAELSNSLSQSVEKSNLNHDTAQPFTNGKAVEGTVHRFVETNPNITSAFGRRVFKRMALRLERFPSGAQTRSRGT